MKVKKINDALLIEKHAAGASGLELAEYFGCSPAAISKRLKRLAPRQPSAIDKLTSKQAAVVKAVAGGESPTSAVERFYDTSTRASARELARRMMDEPEIQQALEEVMNKNGLTRDYRVRKLKEHCDNPDPGTALKALDMSFRLADEYPASKVKAAVVTANLGGIVDLSNYE